MFTLLIKTENKILLDLYKIDKRNPGDAGIDLYVPSDFIVPPRAMGFSIDHEISCSMHQNDISYSYYLYPRSSISNTPLRMSNSVGIIDAGYRGNIIVRIDNLSDQPYCVTRGSRLFQICNPSLTFMKIYVLNENEQLSKTIRGTGGFGSTDS